MGVRAKLLIRCKLSVFDVEEAVATSGKLFVVSDDNERATVRTAYVKEQPDNRLARVGIEISGWLVGEKDSRIIDQ